MIEVCGKSVCGPLRSNNEDSYGFRFAPCKGKDKVILAVADGLGGCPYGEVASMIAVNTALDLIQQGIEEDGDLDYLLKKAFNAANIAILRDCTYDPDHEGMASTLTVAVLDNDSVTVAHYGDCRCYLVRDDDIILITEDHNYVECRSQLTKWLGDNKFIKPDIYKNNIFTGDCVILATDGMYSLFDEEACRDILQNRDDLEALCSLMMVRGSSPSSRDNSTVVIAKLSPEMKV